MPEARTTVRAEHRFNSTAVPRTIQTAQSQLINGTSAMAQTAREQLRCIHTRQQALMPRRSQLRTTEAQLARRARMPWSHLQPTNPQLQTLEDPIRRSLVLQFNSTALVHLIPTEQLHNT